MELAYAHHTDRRNGYGWCQQVPTGADRCRQMPTDADRCRQKKYMDLPSIPSQPDDSLGENHDENIENIWESPIITQDPAVQDHAVENMPVEELSRYLKNDNIVVHKRLISFVQSPPDNIDILEDILDKSPTFHGTGWF
ncbi:unnamed protein product [Psylliodes chrysocephalus]|uniref:Uncharacterized protein n=1 Tax=Psylliodes chrysocephalus TaxID=3402493 RepID=A0A9P0CHR5_9CUCU|nr:unnamed protein product [Psylliodes chrysocephala]